MKTFLRDLEQLELAAELLDRCSPTSARLALVTLDNLIELKMYEQARERFAEDDAWKSLGSKYSPSKRKKVLDYFDDKVNFLSADLKIITPDHAEFLKKGHQLRNEAYHKGILRVRIIGEIAKSYLHVVCSVYPELPIRGYVMSSSSDDERFLFELKKYGLENKYIDREKLNEICGRYSLARPCNPASLGETLRDDLEVRLNETLEGLEYLDGETQKKGSEYLLKWLQFQSSEKYEAMCKSASCGREFFVLLEKELANYNPPVKLSTIQSWLSTIRSFGSAKSYGEVAQKFCSIDDQLQPIEESLSIGIVEYEHHIDMEMEHRWLQEKGLI